MDKVGGKCAASPRAEWKRALLPSPAAVSGFERRPAGRACEKAHTASGLWRAGRAALSACLGTCAALTSLLLGDSGKTTPSLG